MNAAEQQMPGDAPHAFAEPWQADAFALVIALHQKRIFDWPEWVSAFSGQPGELPTGVDQAIESAYYLRWLAALETIARDRGLVASEEMDMRVEQWRRAYLRTPHGHPIELSRGFKPEADQEHAPHHDHGKNDAHHHPAQAVPVSVSPASSR
jgi:nitrile hydratase accessory protein